MLNSFLMIITASEIALLCCQMGTANQVCLHFGGYFKGHTPPGSGNIDLMASPLFLLSAHCLLLPRDIDPSLVYPSPTPETQSLQAPPLPFGMDSSLFCYQKCHLIVLFPIAPFHFLFTCVLVYNGRLFYRYC